QMSLATLNVTDSSLYDQAHRALQTWIEPMLGQDLLSAGVVRQLQVSGGRLQLELQFGFAASRYGEELRRQLELQLLAQTDASAVAIEIEWGIAPAPITERTMPAVKHPIAVASGKRGVGKSTTATNLALALAGEGARVGILDADLYGPSQPRMLGLSGLPETTEGKKLKPMLGHGLQTMSIGFLVDEEAPVIWRGPMITQALNRLL